MRRLLLFCALAGVAAGLWFSAAGCAEHANQVNAGSDWTLIVDARSALSESPSSLTFRLTGTDVETIGLFTGGQGGTFHCRLQPADAGGDVAGADVPLRLVVPPVEHGFHWLRFRTKTPQKPGVYKLTYWGSGYCDVIVNSR